MNEGAAVFMQGRCQTGSLPGMFAPPGALKLGPEGKRKDCGPVC